MESCGSLLTQKYEVGKLLGQGAFAKVHHARNRMTNMAVAIKTIDKEKIFRVGMIDQIKREISVMRLVRHPHVVQLYEVMASKSRIYIIMEYVKGGELFDRVLKGRLKEDAARKYFQQLISAVEYCHSQGVYHRDIKPENLLLDEDGNLKVSDFGLSALAASKHQDGLLHTTCGTPAYVAPEVILRKGYHGSNSDIWSCGVVLFVLLAGFLPFQDSNLLEMYRKIEKAEFKFPRWFPEEASKLIIEILDPNPVTRISMKEIMENPWFQTGLHSRLVQFNDKGRDGADSKPRNMNAFDIISMSAGFDLSSLFEHSGRVEEVWFSSRQPAATILSTLEEVAGCLGLKTRKEKGVLRLENSKVAIDAEIFEVAPSVHLVEMKRLGGDAVDYQWMMDEGIRPALEGIVWTCRGETG